MATEYEPVDSLPSTEELGRIAALSPEQVLAIDSALLMHASGQWRKVAFVVATVMTTIPDRTQGIPDVFYAQHIKELVAAGKLEAHGDLSRMRYSEVRTLGPAHEA